jgi:hypothetical protein
MKLLYTLFFISTLSMLLFSQIPNNSFENWTDGQPDNWVTPNVPGLTAITPVSDAYEGSLAARGDVIATDWPPFLLTVVPGEARPVSVRGHYKFFPTMGDEFWVLVSILKDTNLVGIGYYQTDDTKSSYTEFAADIEYVSSETPNLMSIMIVITGSDDEEDPHIGSYFIVDDIQLSSISDVNDQVNSFNFSLNQNYPNPFNPATVISYQLSKEEFVKLQVYDIIGNEITTLVEDVKPAGIHTVNFNAAGLSNGVYIYKITAGAFQQTRKMTLLK